MPRHKYKPDVRHAVARGIPLKLVDAIIELTGADEEDITVDALLEADLHMDPLDIVELGLVIGVEDDCLEWIRLGDVMRAMPRKAVEP